MKTLKKMLATTLALGMLATSTVFATSEFEDISGHWGEGQILEAVERGYFKGQEEGVFAPDAEITRAEFTVVMMSVRGMEVTEEATSPWYAKYFDAASEAGLLPTSFTMDNFNGDISREEMACMMVTALGQGNFDEIADGNSQDIPDFDEISDEYAHYVSLAYREGLLKGDDDGIFAPKDNATRAAAAVVVLNMDSFLADLGGDDDYGVGDMLPGNPVSEAFKGIMTASLSENWNHMDIVNSESHPDWAFLEQYLGITAEETEGFAITMSQMMTKAFCVAAIKPVSGSEEAVLNGLQRIKDQKISDFTNYLQDQFEYAENAIVEVLDNGVVILVMGEDTEATYAIMKEDLLQLDFTSFDDPNAGVGDMSPDMGLDSDSDANAGEGDMSPEMGVEPEGVDPEETEQRLSLRRLRLK